MALVRIEFLTRRPIDEDLPESVIQGVVQSQELSVSSSTVAVQSASAPALGDWGEGVARIMVLQGSVLALAGTNPTPGVAEGLRCVASERPYYIRVKPGQTVGFVTDADQVPYGTGGGGTSGGLSENLWTDDSGAYYVRIDNGTAISWATISGAASAAPGTGARPAAGPTAITTSDQFQATAAGTGFSVGDFINHIITTDPASGAVLGNFWVDLTTGAKLASAPSSASITPIAALPNNAAQETGGNLAAISAVQGTKADAAYTDTTGAAAGSLPALLKGAYVALTGFVKNKLFDSTGLGQIFFKTPLTEGVPTITTLSRLFSDDFGGTVLGSQWTVYDGGLGAVTQSGNYGAGITNQGAIGSGVTGVTHSVSGSTLAVVMPTTINAEKWFLSNAMFSGAEDVTVVLSKGTTTNTSIFTGLVEVDPITGYPLLNPNLAADFTNRGGVEWGTDSNGGNARLQTVADSSSVATVVAAASALANPGEVQIQFRSEDVHAHFSVTDNAAAKSALSVRISSQVPNDQKVYKFLMRFKNVATATSNTINVYRVLVQDHQAVNVSVTEGGGQQTGSQGLPVNVVQSAVAPLNVVMSSGGYVSQFYATGSDTMANGQVGSLVYNRSSLYNGSTWDLIRSFPGASSSSGVGVAATGLVPVALGPGASLHKLSAAATTNATSVKGTFGRVLGGSLINNSTTTAYRVKFYNKVTAPTVGTDVPSLTVTLPKGMLAPLNLADFFSVYGAMFGAGIAYAITQLYADSDTTAVATAGDVEVNLIYV